MLRDHLLDLVAQGLEVLVGLSGEVEEDVGEGLKLEGVSCW